MSSTTEKATPSSWDQKVAKLRKRPPRELTCVIPDDDATNAVVTARLRLVQARNAARRDSDDQTLADAVTDAERAVTEAEGHAEEEAFRWTLRQLPADVYDTFMLDHPPTEAQRKLGMEYDPRTYSPAIVAACSVNPIDVEVVAAMFWGDPDAEDEDEREPAFNQGEVAKLVQTARDVNEKVSVTLGKASPRTRS